MIIGAHDSMIQLKMVVNTIYGVTPVQLSLVPRPHSEQLISISIYNFCKMFITRTKRIVRSSSGDLFFFHIRGQGQLL